MPLSNFILNEMESILTEWDSFASSLFPAKKQMTSLALRDHAREILHAIAKDISAPQTESARSEKSKGRAPVLFDALETAAQTHAVLRAREGFSIDQLCAEYRALRASVLRLWIDAKHSAAEDFEDMMRFNEAIDQALAESVNFFNLQLTRSRDLLLGTLGHDLRTPLNAILLTAAHLRRMATGEEISEAAQTLIRSGASMKALLDDLIDFNRTKLGLGINITKEVCDLSRHFTDEIAVQQAANPGRDIQIQISGPTQGCWDAMRLQQVLRNLVSNAVKYGSKDTPVVVNVAGTEKEVCIQVANRGPGIEGADFERIFDPLTRGAVEGGARKGEGGLGLGLYIVREVANAHGGRVEVRSNSEETVFTVHVPRE